MKTAVMTDSNSGITPEEGKKIGRDSFKYNRKI